MLRDFFVMFIPEKRIKDNPIFGYLFTLVITAMAGFQGWRTLFNNFSVDIVGVSGLQIGIIQSIREVPGFISLFVVIVLLVIKEHKLSALSVAVFAFGILITGYLPSFRGLLISTFIMSLGFHYFEATNQSLTLQYFEKKRLPSCVWFL